MMVTYRNILVVDDVRMTLMSEKQMLAGSGYRVDLAMSALEALEKMDCHKPDLILLDMMTPTMNGLDFCRRIKNSQRFSNIPVVMVTANNDESVRRMALDAGCRDCMIKPVNRQELLRSVEQALQS